ncbi:ATP-grasp domain-containing protein [Devosia sp. CAU 1758]
MTHIHFGCINKGGLTPVREALALGYDVSMVVTDELEKNLEDGKAPVAGLIHTRKVSNYSDVDELTDALSALHAERPIDAAIPIFEVSSLPLTTAADRLGIASTSAEAVRICRDKALVRKVLAERGIRTVNSSVVESAEAARASNYPFILKPNRGLGSVSVTRIESPDDVSDFFAHATNERADLARATQDELQSDTRIVAEEYIPGTLYSAEIGMSGGRFIPFAISRRKKVPENETLELGSTIPGEDDEQQQAIDLSYIEQVARAVGLDRGIFHIEYIRSGNGLPNLVEINPRIMGGTIPRLYEYATGVSIFPILFDIFLNRSEIVAPVICKKAVSRVVGAVSAGVASQDLPSGWLSEFESRLLYANLDVAAGRSYPKFKSNFSSLGQIHAAFGLDEAADQKIDDILGEISKSVGIDFLGV